MLWNYKIVDNKKFFDKQYLFYVLCDMNVIEMNMSKFQVDNCMILIFVLRNAIFFFIMTYYYTIDVYSIHNYLYIPISTIRVMYTYLMYLEMRVLFEVINDV